MVIGLVGEGLRVATGPIQAIKLPGFSGPERSPYLRLRSVARGMAVPPAVLAVAFRVFVVVFRSIRVSTRLNKPQ